MGNVLEVQTTGDAHADDLQWLNVPNSTIFNDSYVNGVYESLPKFEGTIITAPKGSTSPKGSGLISKIKYSRLLEIFSGAISEVIAEEGEATSNLDTLLSKWSFTETNKKRARLLQRIHLALLREAKTSQQTDVAGNYIVISESKQSVQDPNALLTASSVRMSLAMVKSLGPLKPELYRVVAEAQMDLFRRSSDLALSKVEVGSLQAETVRAIMEYAEDMTRDRTGEDRAQALALMLAVAVTSGSVRDVLSVVINLKKGEEKLPPTAATFMDRLQNLVTELKLLTPSPQTIAGDFKINLSPLSPVPEDQIEHATSSVCTNGVHLFIWDGLRCAIAKIGTGFHGTISGHQVTLNVDVEKQIRERLLDDVYDDTVVAAPPASTSQDAPPNQTGGHQRVRALRKCAALRTSPTLTLTQIIAGSADDNMQEIAAGFEADILDEETHTIEGTVTTFYRVEEHLWLMNVAPGGDDNDSDDSDHLSIAVEVIEPGGASVSPGTTRAPTALGARGGNAKASESISAYKKAWLVYANGKLYLRMKHLLGPYRMAIFSLALKLEDIVEVDLPMLVEYSKAKKLWENKRQGILADLEEEEEEIEWVIGEVRNFALTEDGAEVVGASSNFTSSEGQIEKNLFLPKDQRACDLREGENGDEEVTDLFFSFANNDSAQTITIDLKQPRIPVSIGADFAVGVHPRAVHETFTVHVSPDGESYTLWGSQDMSVQDAESPVYLNKPEPYTGPEEIRYVRYGFGSHTKAGEGCAVYQLFTNAKSKTKKEQQEKFPLLCSDGRHLVFLFAATVKSKDSNEKESLLQAIKVDASLSSSDLKLVSQQSFQWDVTEDMLSVCSFACNSEKILVVHRKGFARREKDEKEVEVNFRTLDLSNGKQINFSEYQFTKSKGLPVGLCYDYRNNMIWAWDSVTMAVNRWRNDGLAPRFRLQITADSGDPFLSTCPYCRLEALKETREEDMNSETEAALILCQLDRIADLYGPPLLPVAESNSVNEIEVMAAGYEDAGGPACRLVIRGQSYGTMSRGFNVVVLNEELVPVNRRVFDTHESDRASEDLESFIEKIEEGRFVLVATMDSATEKLTARASAALRTIGADRIDKLQPRGSFALIGCKGAKAGSVAQSMAEKGKGPVTVRQFLPAPKVPLAVEASAETIKALVSLTLLHFDKVKSRTASRLEKMMLTSCFRLLTTNVYQLLRGTPIKVAAVTFCEEDRKNIMGVVTEVIEQPPEMEGGNTISQGALRLFTTSLDVLYPSVTEKCALLVKYLNRFVEGTLSTLQRSVLEILLRQMSNAVALSNLLHGSNDNVVTAPAVLLDSLLKIAKMESILQLNSLRDNEQEAAVEGHLVGEAAVQMLSSLCNMILSQGSQAVISGNSKSATDTPAAAAAAVNKVANTTADKATIAAAAGGASSVVVADKENSSGKINIEMLLQLLQACGEILSVGLSVNDEIARSSADGATSASTLDEEIDDLLRTSPVGALLPIIVNATAQLAESHGASLLPFGLESLTSSLSTCLATVQKTTPLLPKKSFAVAATGTVTQKSTESYESAHPYASNVDSYTEISFPGALKITFTFDEQCKTENNYDYVKLWKTQEKSETWHPDIEKFTGRGGSENWPGSGGRPPFVIMGDYAYLEFHSDGSNEDWGWKVVAVAEYPMAASSVQAHWLIQLESQLGYCSALMVSTLMKSIEWSKELEDTNAGGYWIEDELFAANILGEDECQAEADVLLMNMVDRPKGSKALKLVQIMQKEIEEDMHPSDEVNRVVYATCAAMIKHSGLAQTALAVTNGELKPVPASLIMLWKVSLQLRQSPELSLIASKVQATTKLGGGAGKADPADFVSPVKKAPVPAATQVATPGAATVDVSKQFVTDVVGRCLLLLRVEVRSEELSDADLAWLQSQLLVADVAKESSGYMNAKSFCAPCAGDSLTLSEVQELLLASRMMVPSKPTTSGVSTKDKSAAVPSAEADAGAVTATATKAVSVFERVRKFVFSSVEADQIEKIREIRDKRCKYRMHGYEMATALINKSTAFSLCAILTAVTTTLKSTLAQTRSKARVHYLNGLDGATPATLRQIEAKFSSFMNLVVMWMTLAAQNATLSTLDDTEVENWRFAVVVCIKACTLDFEQSEYSILQASGLLASLENFLRSPDVQIKRSAWSLMESLVTRCVSQNQIKKISVETYIDDDEEGAEQLKLRLVSLLLAELKKTSADVSAQKLSSKAAELQLIPVGVDIIPGVVAVGKDSLGWSAPHLAIGLKHSFSLWIRRARTANEDLILSRSLKEGCRVTRGPSWNYSWTEDGGEGKFGTVVAIDNTSVQVKWDTKQQKSYRFGLVEDDDVFFDIELADESIAGCIYQKGLPTLLTGDDVGQSWSSFGLQLRGDASLRFFAVSGENQQFICQSSRRLTPDTWTHVAVVQSREKCTIYLDGIVDTVKSVDAGMLFGGKGGKAVQVLESPHPYRDNMDEYTVVETPGAISYTVTFDPQSKTESNYDYVCFFKDDSHSEKWGEDKYSGGRSGSSSNFPGFAGRPPLKIPAGRFVFFFKSDGSNNDWGYKATIVAELPRRDGDEKDLIQVLNTAPFFVGQAPTYVSDQVAFQGGLSRLTVFDRALEQEDIHRLAANSPPDGVVELEDTQVLDVLTLLQRCIHQLTFTIDSSTASATATPSGDRVLLPLLNIMCHGPPLSKISALRLATKIIPQYSIETVNKLISSLLVGKGETKNTSVTFLDVLFTDVGRFLNVWMRFSRSDGGAKSRSASVGSHCCEETGFGIAMEQLRLLHELSSVSHWETEVSKYFDSIMSTAKGTVKALVAACDAEMNSKSKQRMGSKDFDETLMKDVELLYALIGFVGGVLDTLYPGARAGYLRGGDESAVEECIVIMQTWPPVPDAADQEAVNTWSSLSAYGDAIVISLLSDPSRTLTVPASRVTTFRNTLPDKLKSFLETKVDNILSLFQIVVDLDFADPRPTYLPIVTETDQVLVFESSHPYLSNVDTFKEVSMPGAEKITIEFDPQCRTEPNCDYVKFFQDNTKTSFFGLEKYSGRDSDRNWAGTGGKEPLVIPADSFVLHFHSDGSDNDWGYKFTAKAHCVSRKIPPELPPLLHLSVISHIKLLGMRALQARLSDCSSWLVRPAMSLSLNILSTALTPCTKVEAGGGSSRPQVFESAHPYDHNKDDYIPVSIKGAKKLVVLFDPLCATESGCDYLKFYKDDSRTEFWGDTQYTGGKDGGEHNWPCQKGRPPLVIPASSFVLYFHSDGSVNCWGWKITVQGEGVSEGDVGGKSMAGNARCALQLIGEGPAMRPSPEGLDAFKQEAKSSKASAEMEQLTLLTAPLTDEDELLKPSETDKPKDRKRGWPRVFQLNVQDANEASLLAEPKTGATVVTTIASGMKLIATEEQGDWLSIKIDAVEGATPTPAYEGWAQRRQDDNVYLVPMDNASISSGEVMELPAEGEGSGAAGNNAVTRSTHPMNEADDGSTGQKSSYGGIPEQPKTVLSGKLHNFESIACAYTESAIVSYAKEAVTVLVTEWPSDLRFSVDNFGSPSKLLQFVKAIFEKEVQGLRCGQGPDDSMVLRTLRLRLVDAIRHGDSRLELCEFLSVFALRVFAENVQSTKKLKPTKAVMKSVECKHPYDDNMDVTWPLSIPGARWMKIVFDPRSSTEKDCDYVEIYKNADKGEKWNTGKYTGRASAADRNWAGVGSVGALRVNADNCVVSFHSDGSNNDWGFKINCYGIVDEPSEEEIKEYETHKERTQTNSALACWLLDTFSSEANEVIQKRVYSKSCFSLLRRYLEVAREEDAISVLNLLTSLTLRLVSIPGHIQLVSELRSLKTSLLSLAVSQHGKDVKDKSFTAGHISQIMQGLAQSVAVTVDMLEDITAPVIPAFTDACSKKSFELDVEEDSVMSWSTTSLSSDLELLQAGQIVRKKLGSGSRSSTALVSRPQTKVTRKSLSWQIKICKFAATAPIVGFATSDVSLSEPLGADANASVSFGWSAGNLCFRGDSPVPFGARLELWDTVSFLLDADLGTVLVYRNSALVGLALGPVGSGAVIEADVDLSNCVPAVTLLQENDAVLLKSSKALGEKEDEEKHQWLRSIGQVVRLLGSCNSRKLPVQALYGDYVQLCEHESKVSVSTSHPHNNQPFTETVRIPNAKSLVLYFDPCTCLNPEDTIRISGKQALESEVLTLKGFDGKTMESLAKSTTSGVCVGDVVVRGPAWDWGDADGGVGNLGDVIEVKTWKGKTDCGIMVKWQKNGFTGLYRWNVDGVYDILLAESVTSKFKSVEIIGDEVTISIIPSPVAPVAVAEAAAGSEGSAPVPVTPPPDRQYFGLQCTVKPTFPLEVIKKEVRYRDTLERMQFLYRVGSLATDASLVRLLDRFLTVGNAATWKTSWSEIASRAEKSQFDLRSDEELLSLLSEAECVAATSALRSSSSSDGPLVAGPVWLTQENKISRYNDNYSCTVNEVGLDTDAAQILVKYTLKGDNSMGELQSPTNSALIVNGVTMRPAADNLMTENDPVSKIVGVLRYDYASVLTGEAAGAVKTIGFICGSSGYSQVELDVPSRTSNEERRTSVYELQDEDIMQQDDDDFDESDPWGWGNRQTKNSEGNEVHYGTTGSARGTLFCGQAREIPDSDGHCGPNNGPNCAACRALELRRPPRCGNNGHLMAITELRGYTCDRCRKSSSRESFGIRRWRCQECDFDLCPECRPLQAPSRTRANNSAGSTPVLIPANSITLSAAGDIAGGGTGREHLANLLNTGTEEWNKWVHPGSVTESWIVADFAPGKLYRIYGYNLCSANDSPRRDPVAWTLFGKVPGSEDWLELHSYGEGDGQPGFSPSSRWQWLSIDLPSPSPPVCAVKLGVRAVREPGDGLQLGHLQFRAVLSTPRSCAGGLQPTINGVVLPSNTSRPEVARYLVLRQLNKHIEYALPYVDFSLSDRPCSLANLLAQSRQLVLVSLKKTVLDRAIKASAPATPATTITLKLNRSTATNAQRDGVVDTHCKLALLSQACRSLNILPAVRFRVTEGVRLFVPQYEDETQATTDVTAGYKRAISDMVKELHSTFLPLLIKLPHLDEEKCSRNVWCLNPGATAASQLDMLVYLGKMIGVAVRSKEPFTLSLVPIVWKMIVSEVISFEDTAAVSPLTYQAVCALRSILKNNAADNVIDETSFAKTIQQTFSIVSLDGRVVELKPGGASISVTLANAEEYCDLVVSYRTRELSVQVQAIQRGLGMVLPVKALSLFSGGQLEAMVNGIALTASEALLGAKWMYKVVLAAGAKCRRGLELSSDELSTLPFGSTVEVLERRINADNIPRLRVAQGWISEMLNPASGSTGPVSELLPMALPLRFQVIIAEGCAVRQTADLASPEVSRLARGDFFDVSEKLFSADSNRWVRLMDGSGFVWWANSVNENAAIAPVGPLPVNQSRTPVLNDGPMCRNNHRCTLFQNTSTTWYCDLRCGTSREKLGFKRWSCRSCDYDVCFVCHPEYITPT